MDGRLAPSGELQLRVVRTGARMVPWPQAPLTARAVARHGLVRPGLHPDARRWRRDNARPLARGLWRLAAARGLGLPHVYGQLYLSVLRASGERVDLGLAGTRVVTTAGVRYVADDINAASGGADVSNLKFHGLGTGTNAEAAADIGLQTELTTQYQTDSTRPTGSQASATVGANATYTTVATIAVDATVAATEHGIFSAAAAGTGTLLDRTVFAVVNLLTGDAVQATYVLTLASGS